MYVRWCTLFVIILSRSAFASVSISTITPSVPSPQPLGSTISLTVGATDSAPGPITYKFEVAPPSTAYSMARDFSIGNVFTWTPTGVEGSYQLRITVRDYLTGQTAQRVTTFRINALAGAVAVVTPTAHPLVALFSAPNCPSGSQFRVVFEKAGTSTASVTSWSNCHLGTQNVLVGGMLASTSYSMNYQVKTGSKTVTGPNQLTFTTGLIPSTAFVPGGKVVTPPQPPADSTENIVLWAGMWNYYPVATNTSGSPLWYYPDQSATSQVTRIVGGGTILLIGDGNGTGTGFYGVQTRQQVLREVDLAGNILHEVSADRVAEQIMALGGPALTHFNHDAIRLQSGYTAVIACDQAAYPAGTQGSAVPIDVIGNVVMILNSNWQLVSYWDAFQHAGGGTQLDINRAAIRGEVCTVDQSSGVTQKGCPPQLLPGFTVAADWLHGNSIQFTPDNNLLFSLRDQDWVVKIDMNTSGLGNGAIDWRLGLGGDFQIVGTDPYPWFSGQHDVEFQDSTTVSLLDNGDTRIAQSGGNSRGMIFSLDQTNMIATVETSADLGLYYNSMGSAQHLQNGDYMWGSGTIQTSTTWYGQSNEFSLSPLLQSVFNIQANNHSYRIFRLRDFYTAPLPGFFPGV